MALFIGPYIYMKYTDTMEGEIKRVCDNKNFQLIFANLFFL